MRELEQISSPYSLYKMVSSFFTFVTVAVSLVSAVPTTSIPSPGSTATLTASKHLPHLSSASAGSPSGVVHAAASTSSASCGTVTQRKSWYALHQPLIL